MGIGKLGRHRSVTFVLTAKGQRLVRRLESHPRGGNAGWVKQGEQRDGKA